MESLKKIFSNLEWQLFYSTLLILFIVFLILFSIILLFLNYKFEYFVKRKVDLETKIYFFPIILTLVFSIYFTRAWFFSIDKFDKIFNSLILVFLICIFILIYSIVQYLFHLYDGKKFIISEKYYKKRAKKEESEILNNSIKYEEDQKILDELISNKEKIDIKFSGIYPRDFASNDFLKKFHRKLNAFPGEKTFYIYDLSFNELKLLIVYNCFAARGFYEFYSYALIMEDRLFWLQENKGPIVKNIDEFTSTKFENIIKKKSKVLNSYLIPFEEKLINSIKIPLHFFIVQNFSDMFATRRKIIEPNTIFGEVLLIILAIFKFIFLGLLIKIMF